MRGQHQHGYVKRHEGEILPRKYYGGDKSISTQILGQFPKYSTVHTPSVDMDKIKIVAVDTH